MALRMVGRERFSWAARSISLSSRLPGSKDSAVDRGLDTLDHLVVERYGGGPVDVEIQLVRHFLNSHG